MKQEILINCLKITDFRLILYYTKTGSDTPYSRTRTGSDQKRLYPSQATHISHKTNPINVRYVCSVGYFTTGEKLDFCDIIY